MTKATSRTKVLQGQVVSDKRDKTITVQVETRKQHPKYKKIMKVHKKLHVHDAANESKLGDLVEIAACRPISKTKTWRLAKILQSKNLSS